MRRPTMRRPAMSSSIVILVRHAEKAAGNAVDPGLSAAGQQRAKDLVTVLQQVRLDLVVTSGFVRTQETAKPILDERNLPCTVAEAGADLGEHVRRAADLVREIPPGGGALVVGHSNTVPMIAGLLGMTVDVAIAEHEFDRMIILQIDADRTSAVIARYGKAS